MVSCVICYDSSKDICSVLLVQLVFIDLKACNQFVAH